MSDTSPRPQSPESLLWLGEELKRSWSVMRPTQAAAGIVSCVLGFTVVVAWLVRDEGLTRVHPLFHPMPYSVAIGLLVCGVALLGGANGWHRTAGASALAVCALGLGTLVQYGLNVDWNLHRILLAGLIESAPPGMSPSSALSLVLVGVGLVAVAVHPRQGSFVCAISGTTVAAQNGVVFAWYVFELANSHSVTGSAPHVAAGLAVAGVGTIAAAWGGGHETTARVPRWLPLPVALAIALISLSLWDQSESDHRAMVEQSVRLRAQRIGVDLTRRAAPLTEALVRLASAQTASMSARPSIEPRVLAALDLERFPSLTALAFVNPELDFVWIEERAPEASLSVMRFDDGTRRRLLDSRRWPAILDPVGTRHDPSGFLIAAPVLDADRVGGLVIAAVRYQGFFFSTIGEDIGSDYVVQIFAGQRELYRYGGAPADEAAYTAAAALPFLGANWRAEIWSRFGESRQNPFADRTLVFGLLLAGLLGWTVQLAQRSARSVQQLTHATADLRSAIVAKQVAQDARAETEVRYGQIVEAAADIIYRTDLKGRFTFVNPAAIRITKWSRDDLIGRSYLSLIRPDHRDRVRAFYEKQAAERIPSTYLDFPVVTAGGQEIWIGQHVQTLVDGERLVGFQAVARDINHRIRLQEELQRMRDAALETARFKSEFVANTSHEIRTPLNGILGFSTLLLDTDLNGEQRTYAEGLRLSADALLAIVNDVLDFSKIEAGMLRLEMVSFDPRSIIEQSVAVFGEAARQKQIDLRVRMESDVPRRATGDPHRFRQVVTNLLANATKFTDHGAITVTASAEHEAEHVTLKCSVRDTGIGIDAESQRQLFQPFVQADGSTSRRYGGTGLGLAISRQIVELMGGSIGVESSPGRGSTFSFSVRLERAPEDSVVDPSQAPEIGRAAHTTDSTSEPVHSSLPPRQVDAAVLRKTPSNHCILVTDDNPVSRQVTSLLLEKIGHVVETAGNGAEAVEAASRKRYSMIFMDCQMPVMDGYTAASRIRELENGQRHTPIVAFTASARADERERCIGVGMDDVLEKPTRRDALTAVLDRWISSADAAVPDTEAGLAQASLGAGDLMDAATIDTLERQLGAEELNLTIEIYLAEADASLQKMEEAATSGRAAELAREAHRLKGGSLTLGFVRLGRICGRFEDEAEQLTDEQRCELIRASWTAYEDLCLWQRGRSRAAQPSPGNR